MNKGDLIELLAPYPNDMEVSKEVVLPDGSRLYVEPNVRTKKKCVGVPDTPRYNEIIVI